MATKKYRIDGVIYEAESPEEAYAMADAAKAPVSAPEPEHPISTRVVQGSADFLNSFLSRTGSTGRKAVNLALPKSLEPKWATDEAIKAHSEATKPKNAAENFGSFASDWAVGTGIGAGPEIGLAKAGAYLFPKASTAVGPLWGALRGAGRVAANATSGGLQGALLASPEERLQGAAVGFGIGGALGTAGEAGRFGLRLAGKNRMSPEGARVLKELRTVDPEVEPLMSHFGKPGILRSINEGAVANAPGSGGLYRAKHQDLVNTGYRRIVAEIMPVNTPLDTVFPRGGTVHDAMAHLDSTVGSGGAWDRALSKYNQEVFDASHFQLPQAVQEGLDALHLPSTISNDMTGQQLITLRDDIQRVRDGIVAKKALGDEKLGRAIAKPYDDARNEILELMKRKYMGPNNQPLQGMQDYLDDLKNFKNYDTFKSAVAQTSTGEPGFGAIAMSAQRKSPELGVKGQAGPLQTLGNDFASTLGDFPSKQGIFQMAAAQGSTAKVAGGVIPGQGSGGAPAQVAAFVANPLLGTKWAQRKQLEGFSSARSLENFFAKYPSFGRFIRSGAISLTQED